jgi:hypothetical protein
MTANSKLHHRISLLIHSLGLSCLGVTIFLQILVFASILQEGYFRAVENNPCILSLELVLTAFTTVYFIFLYQKIMRQTLKTSGTTSENS